MEADCSSKRLMVKLQFLHDIVYTICYGRKDKLISFMPFSYVLNEWSSRFMNQSVQSRKVWTSRFQEIGFTDKAVETRKRKSANWSERIGKEKKTNWSHSHCGSNGFHSICTFEMEIIQQLFLKNELYCSQLASNGDSLFKISLFGPVRMVYC